MNRGRPSGPPPGLCATCLHVRRVENRRGSVFLLCGRAATDPRFRKYPPLPVLACRGYQEGSGEQEGSGKGDARDRREGVGTSGDGDPRAEVGS